MHSSAYCCFLLAHILTSFLVTRSTGTPVWENENDEVVLFREKRSPLNRALTYSAFHPGGGMAAFASSGEYPKSYYKNGKSNGGFKDTQSSASNEVGIAVMGGEEGRSISGAGGPPPPEGAPADLGVAGPPLANGGAEPNGFEGPGGRKAKKKPAEDDDDYDEYETPHGKSRGGGRSSFNAWFPIMLGLYPGGGEAGRQSDAAGTNGYHRLLGTTIIANSVSNGKSGVAHAIAYGGPHGTPSFGTSRKEASIASV